MVTAVTDVPRHLGVHTSGCHAYLFFTNAELAASVG